MSGERESSLWVVGLVLGLLVILGFGGMSVWSYFQHRDDNRPLREQHTVAQFEAWCTDEFGGRIAASADGNQESCYKGDTIVDYNDWLLSFAG